ncbi:MAG TPA: hypothetical protein ENN87_01325 [Phycisphaerales bacterium]|nr:hypothetical protein [Phycisphaerales bacterium]
MNERHSGADPHIVVDDIFVQAIDWGPAYQKMPPSRRPRLGRWERLVYGPEVRPPGSRAAMLMDAQAWARRLSERTGLLWVVLDGLTEEEVRERAHKLHMTGRIESPYPSRKET